MINKSKKQFRAPLTLPRLAFFLALLLLTASFTPAWAQRAPSTRQTNLEATQVAKDIKITITDKLLREYLSQCKVLPVSDIQAIKANLEYADTFKSRFSNEQESHFILAQSLIAHYSGQPAEAIELAKEAYEIFPDNGDMSAVLITLALYYEDYESAKEIMEKIEAGFEVKSELIPEELTYEPLPFSNEPNKPSTTSFAGEPNIPGSTTQQGNSGRKATLPTGNKWSIRQTTPGTGPGIQNPGAYKKPTAPSKRSSIQSSRPTGSSLKKPRPLTDIRTILELPTDYMPYEKLGDDFGKLLLRSVNGSLFYHDPGQGQMLCALLWTETNLAKKNKTATAASRRTFAGGGSGGKFYPPPSTLTRQGIANSPVIAKATLDLRGNSGQFLQLFSKYLPEGKAKFVGINFDPATQFNRKQMIDKLTTSAWPWTNCMLNDKFNAAQWKMHGVTGAVMLFVDTKGKVRYIGPVGGYLPKMLIEAELKKARAEVPYPVVAANMLQSMDLSKFNSLAAGKTSARILPSDPNGLIFSNQENSPDDEGKTDEDAAVFAGAEGSAGDTSDSVFVLSSPQAKQMMRTAQLQERIRSFNKALKMCDDALERWPDSAEAEKAKEMIRRILRNPRGKIYKDLRTQQGKYVGDEG